jgi:hypothetical protein
MDNLFLRTIVAGLFFALWPICMNRSGLSATSAVLAVVTGVAVIVVPFVLYKGIGPVPQGMQWLAVAGACVTCAVGFLCWGSVLTAATPASLGPYFLSLVLAQIGTSALYQVITSGGLTPAKAAGFVAAGAAAYLLS